MAELPARQTGAALRVIHNTAPASSADVNLLGVPAGEVASTDRFRLGRLRPVRDGMNDPEPAA
ncbi:hypothetical protein ACF08B_38280 [Streptomyces sp. NPDC015139]|uniref:hypothetical protein n=1 Tax=Streptomyces sp. NPDC015139 TaxID=3364942 RepID=UPI0036FA3898